MDDVLFRVTANRMWTLSNDNETLHLQLPPVSIAGISRPLNLGLNFDAAMVDEIIDRLTLLRSQMLPAPRMH